MWPMVWPSPKPVTLTIHPERSRIWMPIREPGGETTFSFPEPEQARFSHFPLPAHERGTLTRDLATESP
jgi:uncharacterized protein